MPPQKQLLKVILCALCASVAPEARNVDLGSSPLHIKSIGDVTRIEVTAEFSDGQLKQLPAGKLSQEQGEQWLRFILVDKNNSSEESAILGTYEHRQGTLVFRPRYPLVHGQCYRATFEPIKGRPTTLEYVVPPRPRTPPAVVEKVYPTAHVLPANQIKFYLHFSKPMRETDDIFDQIQLLDEDGKPVFDPWRRTELWSADSKRLTLWVHPGRVKQGVNLREEMGTAMGPNQEYRLVISADLLDSDGQRLDKAFTKKFRTTAEVRVRVAVDEWKLLPPAAESKEALRLEFPRPLDRALLDRYVGVVNDKGKPVAGRIEVGTEERFWSLHPTEPWKFAEYRVVVDERLEDLAGNTPLRVFDTDLSEPTPPPPRLTITFRTRKQ
jgi:hypothetical protein